MKSEGPRPSRNEEERGEEGEPVLNIVGDVEKVMPK